jgi:hypothetical protein
MLRFCKYLRQTLGYVGLWKIQQFMYTINVKSLDIPDTLFDLRNFRQLSAIYVPMYTQSIIVKIG